MLLSVLKSIAFFLLIFCARARSTYDPAPFATSLRERQNDKTPSSPLQVDLGYEIYEGFYNVTTGLNNWRGIRFAAPPTGANRWQAPRTPKTNRATVIHATSYGAICPQGPLARGRINSVSQAETSEDCLCLNVQAPANASSPLPVFVWIHGGGYGAGNNRQDFSHLMEGNNNSFMSVAFQYRLGAFGFLSSDEVFRNGVVNAGLLDQHFALQWIQAYIHLFGGDPSRVTIVGESAGGGSVMLQAMAYGGTQGESLFTNIFSGSPYLPQQYGYKDWIPSQAYYAFATEVGCAPTQPHGSSSQTIFQCLVAKDSKALVNAGAKIGQSGTYGTWAFVPVTDGVFVKDTPSQQLLQKRVNGRNALSGSTADEGFVFTPMNITTEADFIAWLKVAFPLLKDDDVAKVLLHYPMSNESTSSILFATTGDSGPTALDQSSVATGQQQRAINLNAEVTFVCPSYWISSAYDGNGRTSYHYQFSIPPATHASDVGTYLGPQRRHIGDDFTHAFKQIVGNFVTTGNPSISAPIARGASSNRSSPSSADASDWRQYSDFAPYQMNMNQSGGTPFKDNLYTGFYVTQLGQPGLQNNLTLVNAYTWESNRGERCDFWRSIASLIPA